MLICRCYFRNICANHFILPSAPKKTNKIRWFNFCKYRAMILFGGATCTPLFCPGQLWLRPWPTVSTGTTSTSSDSGWRRPWALPSTKNRCICQTHREEKKLVSYFHGWNDSSKYYNFLSCCCCKKFRLNGQVRIKLQTSNCNLTDWPHEPCIHCPIPFTWLKATDPIPNFISLSIKL